MQVPNTSLSKSNPLSDLAFDELLALADAAWAHSNAFLPGNDEGKTDQYPSILASKSYCMDNTLTNQTNELLSHHHLSSLEQHSIIHEHDNPQGTTCCSIATSQVAPPIPDNGIGAGKKPAEAMQRNMEEKDQGKKMINASAIRIDNNGTPLGKEVQPKRTQKPVSPKPAESNNDQTEKRMCARRKISPTVVTVVESTKNVMPESVKSCCNRYLNFDDKGASNESSADKENATVRPGLEIGLLMQEMDVGLAHDMNTSMRQAATNNYISLPNEQTPSTSPSKNNPPGAKLNANSVENKNKRKGLATAQDGNISNSQISTIGLQMVGYKSKDTGTIKCAGNSSVSLIGARNHGLPSYQSKFRMQFPNTQKKRKIGKGKTYNTHSTSSVTSKKEVPLKCTQQDAQAHPYSSNSNCWKYGGSAYNAVINNAQTFEEFISNLTRLTERSQLPAQTYDCNSLTRIRNSDDEPNYTAKKRSAKKKLNRKRSALSSSAHSNLNGTSKKEVPLKCTQEDAQVHPYASNSNCWKYGGSAYNAVINNAQTFEEFISNLTRLTERSQLPAQTYDCNSLTRIRNSDDEPNYAAKKRSALFKKKRKKREREKCKEVK